MFIVFGLFSFIVYDNSSFQALPSAEKLNWMWDKDFDNLKDQKILPKMWSQIKTIEIKTGDERAKKWVKNIKPPLKENKEGKYHLKILVTSWEDQGELGVLVMFDIFDLKTQNLIWELSRTYILENKALLPTKQTPTLKKVETKSKNDVPKGQTKSE